MTLRETYAYHAQPVSFSSMLDQECFITTSYNYITKRRTIDLRCDVDLK